MIIIKTENVTNVELAINEYSLSVSGKFEDINGDGEITLLIPLSHIDGIKEQYKKSKIPNTI